MNVKRIRNIWVILLGIKVTAYSVFSNAKSDAAVSLYITGQILLTNYSLLKMNYYTTVKVFSFR